MVGAQFPGIIPARAGFTSSGCGCLCVTADHPRSRGVYIRARAAQWSRLGSSPLARGLLVELVECLFDGGIIPARAGFTALHVGVPGDDRDHPRSRGVYPRQVTPAMLAQGSSPLARGLLLRDPTCIPPFRIIPARAGFTAAHPEPGRQFGDHPRSRGVYWLIGSLYSHYLGSSPLARGLLDPYAKLNPRKRIIPARAGFTGRRFRRGYESWDHPRSRGVYASIANNLQNNQGIIPARAGFTPSPLCHSPMKQGSSPLARGLLRSKRTRG